jgi:hypothetical protein
MVPLTGPEIGWAVTLARMGREDKMNTQEEVFNKIIAINRAYLSFYEPPDDPRDQDEPTCAETNGANGDCPIGRTSCQGCQYNKH